LYRCLFDAENVVTLKSGLEVTQDHWKWYHSKVWVYGFLFAFHSNYSRNFSHFDPLHERNSQPASQPDRHPARQTDTARRHRPRLCIASRGKKSSIRARQSNG